MYEKPTLERFGTLRELTLLGIGPDGDGGFLGLGWTDACDWGCDGARS